MKSEPFDSEQKRWYRPYTHLNDLLNLCKYLPPVYQQGAGEELHTIVSVYYDMMRSTNVLKTFDPELLGHFEKSKKKYRWYDDVPSFHQALNTVMVFPEVGLLHLDKRCFHLLKEIYQDLKPILVNPAVIVYDPQTKGYCFQTIEQQKQLLSQM